MWRLVYLLPIMIFSLVLKIPLYLLGLILIPLMASLGRYEKRKSLFFNKEVLAWKDRWMWIWGNEEDGIEEGYQYFDTGNKILQIIYWSAIRNPINNMRFAPFFSIKIDSSKVQFIGSPVSDLREYDYNKELWYVCWQGIHGNFRWQFKIGESLWRFWIGWKIYPEDKIYPIRGYRVHGAGEALQFKKLNISKLTQ